MAESLRGGPPRGTALQRSRGRILPRSLEVCVHGMLRGGVGGGGMLRQGPSQPPQQAPRPAASSNSMARALPALAWQRPVSSTHKHTPFCSAGRSSLPWLPTAWRSGCCWARGHQGSPGDTWVPGAEVQHKLCFSQS